MLLASLRLIYDSARKEKEKKILSQTRRLCGAPHTTGEEKEQVTGMDEHGRREELRRNGGQSLIVLTLGV